MTDAVLGYGSLVADLAGRLVVVRGARRRWTVAMDNGLDLPGYKHYEDDDGVRPAVAVAFLDLDLFADDDVDAIVHPVTPADLERLDRRERQYQRVDVTDRVEGATGRVWTYVGRCETRERAARARADRTLVVVRAYLAAVETAFDVRGARARFDASTDPVDVAVLDLRRVDHA